MPDDEDSATPPAEDGHGDARGEKPGRISRRAMIGGVAGGAAVLAAAVGGAVLLPRFPGSPNGPAASPKPHGSPDGLLVDRLTTRPGFTVAHRGGSLDWPEMSMEAYRNSVALGVNALEIDRKSVV